MPQGAPRVRNVAAMRLHRCRASHLRPRALRPAADEEGHQHAPSFPFFTPFSLSVRAERGRAMAGPAELRPPLSRPTLLAIAVSAMCTSDSTTLSTHSCSPPFARSTRSAERRRHGRHGRALSRHRHSWPPASLRSNEPPHHLPHLTLHLPRASHPVARHRSTATACRHRSLPPALVARAP
jgi:hypothetical protein